MLAKFRAWLDKNWTQILAQIGHFLAGYSFVLTAKVGGHSPFLGLALLQVWAVPKEFIWDYKYETAEQRGSSLLDYLMYQVGAVAGLFVTHAF